MKESNNGIQDIAILKESFRLKKPYVLSFATLDTFLSIQVKIILKNGNTRIAEVVPLFGYNEETAEIIEDNLRTWSGNVIGLTLNDARDYISQFITSFSFSTSPLLTAIDLFNYTDFDSFNDELKYVIPTSTTETDHFSSLLDDESCKLKVKLVGQVETDISGLEELKERIISHPLKIRFDANQGYTFDDAVTLFDYLVSSGIHRNLEYVEQPLLVGQESEMGELRKLFRSIDIMFDESIITQMDLSMATDNDINFIKLKLFKQGGIYELLAIAKEAKKMGISVVLGNGVATKMSNAIENNIFTMNKSLFVEYLESNGFKKIYE